MAARRLRMGEGRGDGESAVDAAVSLRIGQFEWFHRMILDDFTGFDGNIIMISEHSEETWRSELAICSGDSRSLQLIDGNGGPRLHRQTMTETGIVHDYYLLNAGGDDHFSTGILERWWMVPTWQRVIDSSDTFYTDVAHQSFVPIEVVTILPRSTIIVGGLYEALSLPEPMADTPLFLTGYSGTIYSIQFIDADRNITIELDYDAYTPATTMYGVTRVVTSTGTTSSEFLLNREMDNPHLLGEVCGEWHTRANVSGRILSAIRAGSPVYDTPNGNIVTTDTVLTVFGESQCLNGVLWWHARQNDGSEVWIPENDGRISVWNFTND